MYPRLGMRLSMMGLSHRRERKRSLSWLPDTHDLPGKGWVITSEGTWRPGIGKKSEASKQSRQSGMMIAASSFSQPSTRLWANASVFPTASPSDAQPWLPTLNKRIVPSPHARVKIVAERMVEDIQAIELCAISETCESIRPVGLNPDL